MYKKFSSLATCNKTKHNRKRYSREKEIWIDTIRKWKREREKKGIFTWKNSPIQIQQKKTIKNILNNLT